MSLKSETFSFELLVDVIRVLQNTAEKKVLLIDNVNDKSPANSAFKSRALKVYVNDYFCSHIGETFIDR